MTQALEFTIGRLWTLQVTWLSGMVTRYPASNEQEAIALQTVLEAHTEVAVVQRYLYDEADLVPHTGPAVTPDPGMPLVTVRAVIRAVLDELMTQPPRRCQQ